MARRFIATVLLPLFVACAALQPQPSSPPTSSAMAMPQSAAAAAGDAALPPDIANAEPNGGRIAAFSPDGTRIAFLSSTLHTPSDLWVMNADGSQKRRLTVRGATGLRWAPDGRGIYITARRKGYDEVLLVHLTAPAREERIAWLPPNASFPLFSPDGALFAFTALGSNGVSDLWVGTSDRSRVEAVTENINVRSFFWGPEGRKIFYEPGKTYGLGLWELDLATMAMKPILSKYVGTPGYSAKAGRVAYPYPTSPGEFEVRTMNLDGSEMVSRKAPRLARRWIAWAPDASGVYYLGGDVQPTPSEEKKADVAPGAEATPKKAQPKKKSKRTVEKKRQGRSGARVARANRPAAGGEKVETDAAGAHGSHGGPGQAMPIAPHGTATGSARTTQGATSLWRLDLESGSERRVSPAELHVLDFSFSPDGTTALVTGLLPASRAPEIFRVELATGDAVRLVSSRASAWMPVPSPDATRVAYFTNEGALEAIHVADLEGNETASYPGFSLEADTRVLWLPRSDGLAVFSGRGLHAFSEGGPIPYPDAKDLKAFLYADASLHADKIALTAVPKFGDSSGLYLIEAVDGVFVQKDLRYPVPPEEPSEQYLQPRWSADGEWIAFTDRIDVWTMKADGTQRRRLTSYWEANAKGQETQVLASFPVWSTRGRRLAYTLTTYAGASVVREIWVIGADGSSPERVFSEEVDSQLQIFLHEYTSAPFFDHSDEHLFATAFHRGLANIVSIDLAGGKVTALTETGAVFPAMLPEEDSIVYTSLEGNDERIWIMEADGSGKRPFLKATPQGATRGEAPASSEGNVGDPASISR